MKFNRKLLSFICALVLLTSLPAALAAGPEDAPETVRAGHWNSDVWVDNLRVEFANEHGRPALLFAWNGTVYIPLRTAGEWMGCGVAWDQEAQTVRLTSGGQPVFRTAEDALPLNEEELSVWSDADKNGVEVVLRPDISIVVDGEERHFANVNGDPVYPAVCRQMIYLPIRSIGALCGFTAAWVPAKEISLEAIYLHSPLTETEGNAIRRFVNEGVPISESITALADQLLHGENSSDTYGLARFNDLLDCLDRLKALAKPSALCAKPWISKLNLWIRETESAVNFHIYQIESGTESFAEIQSGILFPSDLLSGSKNIQSVFSILKDVTPDLW